MTPQYLNKSHVEKEKYVANLLAKKWNCKVEHQHKFSSYDCIAHRRQNPLAFVELRVLNYKYYDLDSIMISLTKLIAGRQQTEITGIKSLFVVHWAKSQDTGWIDVNNIVQEKPDFRVTLKNTNRLNAPEEIEVCRYIPTSRFNIIGDNFL